MHELCLINNIFFSRLPSLQDIKKLPFTEAFLLEVMRRATAVPLGTPHVASEYAK